MAKESFLPPKAPMPSQGNFTPVSKRRLRPPPDLVLKATKPTTAYPNDGSEPASNCQTCSKTLSRNLHLCDDCQIWNDAHHVFECLGEHDRWAKLNPILLGQVLARKDCMVCRAIGEAALESLEIDSQSVQHQLLEVEIQSYGPFCLLPDQYATLNPALLQKQGLHRIDPNDMRLAGSSVFSETPKPETTITLRAVVYFVMVAPMGSHLRSQYPHIDECRSPRKSKENSKWSDNFYLGIYRSIDPESYPHDIIQPTFGLQVDLTYGNDQTKLSAVERWSDMYIDTAKFLELSEICKKQHEKKRSVGEGRLKTCSLDSGYGQLPAGFRAIDTRNQCIVDLPVAPLVSYVALSYTWGGTSGCKELQLERSNCQDLYEVGSLLRLGGIPDLILDAIKFCADIGERYLWVDRLCIVQDDSESKMQQINAMDRIYHMASLTVVAAVPPGMGLPGVVGRPRRSPTLNHSRRFHPKLRIVMDNFRYTVLDSFWNTRGWTFQERILSRRAIYITEWQAYWICARSAVQEEIGDFGASYNPWDLHKFSTYATTVAEYTTRNLTFGSDILNAFAGIGNQFAKMMEKPLVYGLPQRFLARALLWINDNDLSQRSDVGNIPSWSWAAWEGRSLYDFNSGMEKLTIGTLVRFYLYQSDRGMRRIDEDEVWFFRKVNLDTLEQLPKVDPLYPEMRFMPDFNTAEDDWRACLHNPWSVAMHGPIDHVQVPGLETRTALVFNTTSALVTLRIPTIVNAAQLPGFVRLEILDDMGVVVGQTARILQTWAETNLDLSAKHEIIVVAAGLPSEASRHAQLYSTLHVSGEIQDPRTEDSAWYLHVMLIRRDKADFASRLGIGAVEMRRWNNCKPEWRTIILV